MHRNNFDFLRLLFAVLVVLTHCFTSTGMGEMDALTAVTHNQISFSRIGLTGFFTLSGYLIFESLIRSRTLWSYFKKRILRIYPGLIVVLIIGVLVGAVVSVDPIQDYFLSAGPYKYFKSEISLWYNSTDTIPGVFENNPYPRIVNTSLWTIVYEFTCYILLAALFFIKDISRLISAILVLLFFAGVAIFHYSLGHAGTWQIGSTNMEGRSLSYFGTFFFAGSAMASLNAKAIRYKVWIVVACICFCLISLRIRHFDMAQFFILPPIYILFGLMATRGISDLSKKIGDLSYGIYLYGWLVQQTVLHYHRLNYWQLFLVVMPILVACALLSWNFVEKKALALKYS